MSVDGVQELRGRLQKIQDPINGKSGGAFMESKVGGICDVYIPQHAIDIFQHRLVVGDLLGVTAFKHVSKKNNWRVERIISRDKITSLQAGEGCDRSRSRSRSRSRERDRRPRSRSRSRSPVRNEWPHRASSPRGNNQIDRDKQPVLRTNDAAASGREAPIILPNTVWGSVATTWMGIGKLLLPPPVLQRFETAWSGRIRRKDWSFKVNAHRVFTAGRKLGGMAKEALVRADILDLVGLIDWENLDKLPKPTQSLNQMAGLELMLMCVLFPESPTESDSFRWLFQDYLLPRRRGGYMRVQGGGGEGVHVAIFPPGVEWTTSVLGECVHDPIMVVWGKDLK